TYRDYGEFVAGIWCNEGTQNLPVNAPVDLLTACPKKVIAKGDPLPDYTGEPHGSASPFPWNIPVLAGAIPAKRELRDHTDLKYFPWSLEVPDQLRADEFLNEFNAAIGARKNGAPDPLPALMLLRMGNDHTAGTKPGIPRPEALVADNDLALGRIV